MVDWRTKSLADLCIEISYGYTESAKNEKVGPKFLRITDIASGRLDWANVPYCQISDSDFDKYKLLPGDIVIARTGATTGANYTMRNLDPRDVVFASYLIRYRIDEKQANPNFIGNVLQSSNWKEYVDAIAGGSAQPGANAKQLGSFEISLPPLPEQTAIASVLSSLDDKIDLLHRQNATLEKMAETLFRQWFVEEAKEEWEMGKVEDLFVLQRGFDLPIQNRISGNFPIVASSGESGFHHEFKVKGPGVTTGRSGVLGNVFYVQDNFWPLNTSLYIKEYKNSSPLHAYFTLKSIDLNGFNAGSAVPTLNRNHVHELPIEIPPIELILKFDKFVNPFFRKIKSNQTQIRTLTALRDTLLPKLMSGEVRVEQ
jgi:type I restriction enzyme S subunit